MVRPTRCSTVRTMLKHSSLVCFELAIAQRLADRQVTGSQERCQSSDIAQLESCTGPLWSFEMIARRARATVDHPFTPWLTLDGVDLASVCQSVSVGHNVHASARTCFSNCCRASATSVISAVARSTPDSPTSNRCTRRRASTAARSLRECARVWPV